MDIANLPILGICGLSGSGKTTLIEKLLRRLQNRNLKIAVVKHSSKIIDIDRPGKDSYRFFSAEADVCFHSQNEHFWRSSFSDQFSLDIFLRNLSRLYDLVLVEGYKSSAISKVVLLNKENEVPPDKNGTILDYFPFGPGRTSRLLAVLDSWLPMQWNKVPVYGCVLIGGKSSRMGRPKHLIENDGVTWLELTLEKMSQFCTKVIVAGAGQIPDHLKVTKLPDIVDAQGPISGIGAALRWAPWASWLITACDLPDIRSEAINWLLQQRKPGVWAVFPSVEDERVEPLFAFYDFRIHNDFETMIYNGETRPSNLQENNKVEIVRVPGKLEPSWRNVNYPRDIYQAGN